MQIFLLLSYGTGGLDSCCSYKTEKQEILPSGFMIITLYVDLYLFYRIFYSIYTLWLEHFGKVAEKLPVVLIELFNRKHFFYDILHALGRSALMQISFQD